MGGVGSLYIYLFVLQVGVIWLGELGGELYLYWLEFKKHVGDCDGM